MLALTSQKGMDLGKLREIRRKRGISLETMEGKLRVSRELLGKYESGKASPRLCFLLEWCEYLDVRIGFLDELSIVSKQTEG